MYTGPGLFTFYPKRKNSSHKGQNGKILILGGSNHYHGSVVLAGKAAFSLNIVSAPTRNFTELSRSPI